MFKKISVIAGMFALSAIQTLPAKAAGENSACSENIKISFAEGAPVDKFIIKNNAPNFQIAELEIDLSNSKGRLIFDTVPGGKGIEVFQPFKTVSGQAKVINANAVKDGTDRVALEFEQFANGQDYTFSIDVDDQLTSSELGQIRVTGGEMESAQANFVLTNASGEETKTSASFGKNNQAILFSPACQS